MDFTTWRGSVGVIKPTLRLGGLEEFFHLIPKGIATLPLYLNIREGTTEEFKSVLDHYEEKVKELAEVGVDLIHPEGAPPFMVHGLAGETKLVQRWEQSYGVPILTSSMSQLEAMRALNVHRIIGISYFRGEINETFARYFTDAGIDVAAMEGMDVEFNRAQWLDSREVYAFARELFLRTPGVDGIYLLGSGWHVLDIVSMLEQDLEVPVIHAQTARVWAIQKRLHVNEKTYGYGRLLEELPPLPSVP